MEDEPKFHIGHTTDLTGFCIFTLVIRGILYCSWGKSAKLRAGGTTVCLGPRRETGHRSGIQTLPIPLLDVDHSSRHFEYHDKGKIRAGGAQVVGRKDWYRAGYLG
jgi:hypothetical protein